MICCAILLFSVLSNSCINCLQCRDVNNEELDWFAVYKIPKLKHKNQLIEKGLGFVYVTSKDYGEWKLSEYSINDTRSILGNTLKPYYLKENVTSYVLYNDQPPNEPNKDSKGHTKGVVMSDLKSGFWLIHSVPHFPPLSAYELVKSETLKGQSFLCISLDLKNLNKVGIQLQYNEPQIYDSYITESLQTKLSNVVAAVSGDVITKAPWYNKITISSINRTQFTSFAKGPKFGKELYHDWVAPALNNDLLVETWLNGHGRLPSNCTKSVKVYNIQNIAINAANVEFSSSEDHSKWAVSVYNSWTCIGDINRMQHQKFRGGGTVCLNNQQFTENYRNLIVSIEKCLSNIL